jgi:hypothetical protein
MGETHNAESPKIFISHSSRDITLVESLIKLIRDSLNLTASPPDTFITHFDIDI